MIYIFAGMVLGILVQKVQFRRKKNIPLVFCRFFTRQC